MMIYWKNYPIWLLIIHIKYPRYHKNDMIWNMKNIEKNQEIS
jgi:hypothetical protein